MFLFFFFFRENEEGAALDPGIDLCRRSFPRTLSLLVCWQPFTLALMSFFSSMALLSHLFLPLGGSLIVVACP